MQKCMFSWTDIFKSRDPVSFSAMFNIHSLRQAKRVPIERYPSENIRFEAHNGDREVKILREDRAAQRGENDNNAREECYSAIMF